MNWKAKWIWDSGEEKPLNYYAYFRKAFDLTGDSTNATARICADSRYKLFVNGTFVSRGPVRSDPRWQSYDIIDLKPYLRSGRNVIAILVHHYGTGTFSYILGRGGLLFDGAVTCPSAEISLTSDDSWKVLPAQAWFQDMQRMDVQLEFNEVYDANLGVDGWTGISFDDSSWQQAKVLGEPGMQPWPTLHAREIPFLYEREIFPVKALQVGIADPVGADVPKDNKAPIAYIMGRESKHALDATSGIITDPNGVCRHPDVEDIFAVPPLNPYGTDESIASRGWRIKNLGKDGFTVHPLSEQERYAKKAIYVVLDFGREIVGFPRIRLSTKGKGTIDLGYGELLDSKGTVYPCRNGVNYADRYKIRPGSQEWETFDKRAFRYMQIDFRDLTEPVHVESVSVNFTTYPVQWRGKFECSDQRLNDIWRIGAYTVQLNMEDGYTDCPWRERTQWWGDGRIQGISNYYAFGDTHLIRQGIKHIGQSQRADGATQPFWPGSWDNVIPAFCCYWIMSILDYYVYTGDKSIVPEVYPRVKNVIKWFEGFRDKHGLLTDVPGWMFIEWTNGELEGTVAALNCLYHKALLDAADLAILVNDPDTAKAYRKQAQEVKDAINTHLFDTQRGAYPEYWSEKKGMFSPKISQMVNSLVANYDIAPKDRSDAVLKYALDPKNQVVPCGSFFAYYLLEAMLRKGLIQESLDYIRTNWGQMLDWGATTLWELWSNNSSLCHGWASAPTIHLPTYIMGIRPTEPGFKRFTVSPNPGDLKWAKTLIPSVSGDIHAQWTNSDNSFDLTLTIPNGTTADVSLPLPVGATNCEVEVNDRKSLPAGVTGRRIVNGRAMFTVSRSDTFVFTLRTL